MDQPVSSTVQLRSRGVLTIPKALRDRYNLNEGDALHLADVDGTFVLTPLQPVVPSLAQEIERLREEAGLMTDELLERLRDERAALTRERYGNPPAGERSGDATEKTERDSP
jgi:AbrB family looped-hinge helix DNA binding protein